MNYMKMDIADTANGEGLRISLFVSGCSHACKGCFNKDAWSYQSGSEFGLNELMKICVTGGDEAISGLSILGGEPLSPKNIQTVSMIISRYKHTNPDKTIWLWTGYTMGGIMRMPRQLTGSILALVDVIIDGKFIESQPTNKPWRGSDNQRMWVNTENGWKEKC